MITKLTKAKIKLQEQYPFFGRLSLSLKFKKDEKGLLTKLGPFATTRDKVIYYNENSIKDLSQEHLMAHISHEIMHIVLRHFERLGDRNRFMFNLACDIVSNNILVNNNFILDPEMVVPLDNVFILDNEIMPIYIKDIDKKSAEQVYNELLVSDTNVSEVPDHEYCESYNGFDSELQDSISFAKDRGREPVGIINSKHISWEKHLRKYFSHNLISNYSFSKPKRLAGIILPGPIKEDINILIHIDTSASIGKANMESFVSELVRIKSINRNVSIDLILCNDKITGIHKLKSGINLKFSTGGNTSHKPVVKFLNSKNKYKIYISMTDGYSDIEECYGEIKNKVKRLILLTDDSMEKELSRFAKIILMR